MQWGWPSRDLELRAKGVWRWGNLALAIVLLLVGVLGNQPADVVGAAIAAAFSLAAFLAYIRLDDGVLYRRRWRTWYDPIDLHRLRQVRLERNDSKEVIVPRLELHLRDADGHQQTISLRWWGGSVYLLALIGRLVLDPTVAEGLAASNGVLDLEPKTRKRLVKACAYVDGW
jgi:hypothetical protein